MTALGSGVAQARSASGLVRDVVLEIALLSRSAAHRSRACGVPDLGQVPQLDTRIMTGSLEAVVTCLEGDQVERDQQVRLPGSGGQPPGAVSAGRPVIAGSGERESRPGGGAGARSEEHTSELQSP